MLFAGSIRLAGPTAFRSAVSISSSAVGALGLQMRATLLSVCMGYRDLNSGSHNGTSVLSTEQSLQPTAPFSKKGKTTVPTPDFTLLST